MGHARTIFCLKLSINNHIVGFVHKKHIIRTRLMYHAACKVEFQPFKRLYSADVFQLIKIQKNSFRRGESHATDDLLSSGPRFFSQNNHDTALSLTVSGAISGPMRNKRRAPPTR